jgi:hypothetical protein
VCHYRRVRILLMAGAVIGVLGVVAPGARADERRTTMSLGVAFGAQSSEPMLLDGPSDQLTEGFGGPRLALSWEHAPLPYPANPGYAVDAGLVPELVAGAFLDDEKAEGMLGVGLRGELRVSQKQQGLFKVSIRAAFYVTGRALVVGEQRDVMGELVVGEYILVGRGGRFGFEVGGMARRADSYHEATRGIVGQLYLGWRL